MRSRGLTAVLLSAALVMLVGTSPVLAQTSGATLRDEIPDQYKWDLSHIYKDWTAWEAGLMDLERLMDEYAALKGTLAGGPENVHRAFKLYDDLDALLYKVYGYSGLSQALDNANNEISAKFQKVNLLLAKFGTATAWFSPELLAIPWDTMEKWLADYGPLAPYRFNIEDEYRLQKHVLDEDKERLISYFASFANTPFTTYNDLSISDIEYNSAVLTSGDTVKITPGRYRSILAGNRNQEDRGRAFEAHYSTYHVNRNTYASIYSGVLQRDWAMAQARQYHSCLEATLNTNNIPVKVVELLISAVRNGLEPLQRYHRIRKEKLGLETYHGYDGSIPIIDYDREYEYKDATEWVYESVAPLGKSYQKTVRQALDNRWIDVYESDGKTTGAFSADVYGVHPYLLLNYNKTLSSVFTLAHEIGHCMHSHLAQLNQPKSTADYTLFVAEVASAVNEALLLDFMLEKSKDPLERVAILLQAIDDLEGTFYSQAMFADYELQAHRLAEQGQPITADVLSEVYIELWKEQAGDVTVFDTLYGSTWCRISHFYEVPFYVYQYATCYAAAGKILEDIRSKDKKTRQEALDRFLTLLKSGGNDYPMEQLRKAGVDMSDPATYTYVIKQMDRLVTRLETEIAKL